MNSNKLLTCYSACLSHLPSLPPSFFPSGQNGKQACGNISPVRVFGDRGCTSGCNSWAFQQISDQFQVNKELKIKGGKNKASPERNFAQTFVDIAEQIYPIMQKLSEFILISEALIPIFPFLLLRVSAVLITKPLCSEFPHLKFSIKDGKPCQVCFDLMQSDFRSVLNIQPGLNKPILMVTVRLNRISILSLYKYNGIEQQHPYWMLLVYMNKSTTVIRVGL